MAKYKFPSDQPLKLSCKNNSYKTQGHMAAGNLITQPPSIRKGGLSKEGNQMCNNTQEYENVDLKTATMNPDHDECSCTDCPAFGPVCTRAGLHLRLTESPRPRFLAQMLHVHRDAVRAHSLAKALTQSLLFLECVNCTPSSD